MPEKNFWLQWKYSEKIFTFGEISNLKKILTTVKKFSVLNKFLALNKIFDFKKISNFKKKFLPL